MQKNIGPLSIQEILKEKPQQKETKITQWQDLALRIIKELHVDKKDKGIIFKICKQYPYPFVEHCFNETKELATGDKASHYFVKLVYAK